MDDAASLILAALAAGTGAGVSDTAGSVVRDSYQALKDLMRRRLAGQPAAERALEEFEPGHAGAEDPLHQYLSDLDAADQQEIVTQAKVLLRIVNADAGRGPALIVKKNKGVQVGNRSSQINIF